MYFFIILELSVCFQQSNTGQSVEFSPMELSALVGTPAAPNVPAEEGAGMSGVTGEELFDPLDFLRELEAEASQPTSTTTPSSYRRQRHNIAAANPLLAGKLSDCILTLHSCFFFFIFYDARAN